MRLGDISRVDLVREGLPELDADAFAAMYCSPGKPHPHGIVTRIVWGVPA